MGFQQLEADGAVQLSPLSLQQKYSDTVLASRAGVGVEAYVTEHIAVFGERLTVPTGTKICLQDGSEIENLFYAGGSAGLVYRVEPVQPARRFSMLAPCPPVVSSSSFGDRGFFAALVCASAVLLISLTPQSAAAELGYVEYSAGVSIAPNQNLTGDGATGAGLSGSASMDAGYSVGLAVGTDVVEEFGAVLRGEVALNWRSNEVNAMNVAGEASSGKGDLGLFTAMINAYVDYDLRLPIVPYVGLGVGYGLVRLNAENAGSFLKISDRASVFAWNAMIGGTLAFTTTTDFTMGYRYTRTTDPKLDGRLLATGSQRFDSEYDTHEILLGMRVNF